MRPVGELGSGQLEMWAIPPNNRLQRKSLARRR